ncbi:MAG TPA: DUF6084 family protein [Pirellulales bacterium]|nr:DUF6084 family protein [Pirellulales bacterium]
MSVDLDFQVEGAEPHRFAVAPHLLFKLRLTDRGAAQGAAEAAAIESVSLQCQIRIEPTRRGYADGEKDRLFELFGKPADWGRTVKSMLWTHASVNVRAFRGETQVDLPVPCGYDFNVAATRYFAGLQEGEVPLCLLFSGSVFYQSPEHGLQIAPISWEREAVYRLPVRVWQDMIDEYYPNSVWVCLRRDVYEQIDQRKRRLALATWEQSLESLLADEEITQF